ncbi:MAG: TVP38/TMEM64 family protein [Clostridiaceae bacterium]
MKNKKKLFLYIIISIILILFIAIAYKNVDFSFLLNVEKMKEFVLKYGSYSFIIYIILQIIQVILFFIPGEIVQIAGGSIFGVYLGSILSVIGISIGSFITYNISNKFGRNFVNKYIPQDKIRYFNKNFGDSRKNLGIFIIYLIPGMPKDIIGYICGVSTIKIKDFMIYSTIGRIPCIAISAYFGEKFTSKDYTTVIVIAVVMTLLFIIGTIKGDDLIRKITKTGRKLKKNRGYIK